MKISKETRCNASRMRDLTPGRHGQAGLSLVEVMVAIVISLLLLLGMTQMMIGNQETYRVQNTLQRFQENARIASVILSNAIGMAGFHLDPVADPLLVFSPTNPVITGTGSGATPDVITVSYENDGTIFDCLGNTTGTATSPVLVSNTFSIDSSSNTLRCSVNGGAAQALISNIENMAVRYGVDSSGDGSVDQYLWADEITAAGTWNRVLNVGISVMAHSDDGVNPSAGSAFYSLLGAVVSGPPTGTDRRARRAVTRFIALNNRLYQII
jgi:type IV pilus assembly protein PilW